MFRSTMLRGYSSTAFGRFNCYITSHLAILKLDSNNLRGFQIPGQMPGRLDLDTDRRHRHRHQDFFV